MIAAQRYTPLFVLIPILAGFAACAGMPKIEKPQYTQRHYIYSALLFPDNPGESPQLEFAMSLLCMEYPQDQADALHEILYGQLDLDEYRDSIFNEQRKNYRTRAGDLPFDGNGSASFNWRYAEKFNIKQIFDQGIVIERDLETYSGGAHPGRITRYYNITIDPFELMPLTLDDLFSNFQEDQKFRDIVYNELRNYNNLDSGKPLSQGIYFNNEPELTFNFFITEEGLGLHWDSAQIAPHVNGSIQVVLPWHLIQPLMLYPGVELLEKFNIHLSYF
ncbi:MAG: RsiV family protein [Treponema sp.]|nr:RsiV family protein [Treponema sp.]